jgi:hypothetical protein
MDDVELIAAALGDIATALQRLATVAERVYPPPPDRSTVTPAPEAAYSRARLKELTQWEHDERILGSRLK